MKDLEWLEQTLEQAVDSGDHENGAAIDGWVAAQGIDPKAMDEYVVRAATAQLENLTELHGVVFAEPALSMVGSAIAASVHAGTCLGIRIARRLDAEVTLH